LIPISGIRTGVQFYQPSVTPLYSSVLPAAIISALALPAAILTIFYAGLPATIRTVSYSVLPATILTDCIQDCLSPSLLPYVCLPPYLLLFCLPQSFLPVLKFCLPPSLLPYVCLPPYLLLFCLPQSFLPVLKFCLPPTLLPFCSSICHRPHCLSYNSICHNACCLFYGSACHHPNCLLYSSVGHHPHCLLYSIVQFCLPTFSCLFLQVSLPSSKRAFIKFCLPPSSVFFINSGAPPSSLTVNRHACHSPYFIFYHEYSISGVFCFQNDTTKFRLLFVSQKRYEPTFCIFSVSWNKRNFAK
jgi:hypothetical protein